MVLDVKTPMHCSNGHGKSMVCSRLEVRLVEFGVLMDVALIVSESKGE